MAHIELMMRDEIKPGVDGDVQDLDAYIRSILERFDNPTIRHLLSQIAWDGSQKLPFRILGTIRDNAEGSRGIERLCVSVAAWMHFIRWRVREETAIVDPMVDALTDIAKQCTGRGEDDIPLFAALQSVFSDGLLEHARVRSCVVDATTRSRRKEYEARCAQDDACV